MMTVAQAAAASGVTVRTLRYYDRVGLLHPDQVSPAGYRLYGDKATVSYTHLTLPTNSRV